MSRTIFALVLREMTTTYGRSPAGYVWAVLEPAAGIVLLTFVFSLALQSPPLGTNFSLYYATGLLPFLSYLTITNKTATALRFSRPLMAFPAVTFVDALLARFVLNALTQIMVTGAVITSILIIYRLDAFFDVPLVLSALGLTYVLGFGIGTLNCYLLTRFPIWEYLWAILNRPMFIISCIFFLFESVPEPYRSVLWYNPLAHVVGQFRRGVYPTYTGDYVSPVFVLSVSLVTFLAGLILLRRHHRMLLEN